jgi:DNA modification methylase
VTLHNTILCGDALSVLRSLPAGIAQTCVTSPPYWGLRDYGVDGQLGLEATPEEGCSRLVMVFREVKRVLRDDGTCWVNLGDTYFGDSPTRAKSSEAFSETWDKTQTRSRGGKRRSAARLGDLKPKDLVGIPWMVAFALRADGWYLRAEIIWSKNNPMPESVRDRPTKSHEQIFLLAKSERYHYDADAVREPHTALGRPPGNKSRIYFDRDPQHHNGHKRRPEQAKSFHALGRNKRSVWTVATAPYSEAHFATFPPKLIEPCVLAGAPAGGLVLDPFMGAGTVGVVARRHSRHYLGIELNPAYVEMAERRIANERQPVLWTAASA